MANVQIGADGANPAASDSLGMFTLEFPQRQPGHTVRLVVNKEGYEVVNDVQVTELTLPSPVEARTVTILLCKEGSREEMARRYYRLKSIEAIDETYKRRLKELEEKEQATAEAQTRLQQQREEAIGAAGKAAEELAKEKPQEASEIYRKAMQLFLDGKVDEALAILSGEKLQRMAAEAREKKAQAEKAIEEAVQAWLLRARILTVQFRFSEADQAYREAIEISPESLEANFAFARFSQNLNRYGTAEPLYLKCLELARRSGNQPDVAMTLNNLGVLNREQNRMEEARMAFKKALKTYRELAQKNPEVYLPYVATTLNNLGVLNSDQNRNEEARMAYEEALKTYRELAQKNPEVYLPYVATTLNNLGVLNTEQNRNEEARMAYEEALKICRELAQKNPEVYLPHVATTLNNLGNLNSKQNRKEEARKAFEEALKIRRELAQENPEVYLPYVATTLNNLGVLNSNQNRKDEARKAYVEALKTYLELAQKNPEVYLPYVARTLSNIGILNAEQNRKEEARKVYEEALQIYEGLAKHDSDRFAPDVARIQSLLDEIGP